MPLVSKEKMESYAPQKRDTAIAISLFFVYVIENSYISIR